MWPSARTSVIRVFILSARAGSDALLKTLEEGCRWDAQGAPSAGEVSQPGQLLRQEVSDDEDRAANCRKYDIMTG